MREAVIVSYARTGLAKAGRGGFNVTPPMSMAAHAIKHAVAKSGVDPADIEDCYLGNNAHGAANIGRLAALLAGLIKYEENMSEGVAHRLLVDDQALQVSRRSWGMRVRALSLPRHGRCKSQYLQLTQPPPRLSCTVLRLCSWPWSR